MEFARRYAAQTELDHAQLAAGGEPHRVTVKAVSKVRDVAGPV